MMIALTKFLKNKIIFQKTVPLQYHFLAESTRIENATFTYKTVLSEANIRTNRMGSTKWTYHKELSFAAILLQEY